MSKTPPSLISSNLGKPKLVKVKKVSKCKICNEQLLAGNYAVDIKRCRGMGNFRYCINCFYKSLEKTSQDFNTLCEELEPIMKASKRFTSLSLFPIDE